MSCSEAPNLSQAREICFWGRWPQHTGPVRRREEEREPHRAARRPQPASRGGRNGLVSVGYMQGTKVGAWGPGTGGTFPPFLVCVFFLLKSTACLCLCKDEPKINTGQVAPEVAGRRVHCGVAGVTAQPVEHRGGGDRFGPRRPSGAGRAQGWLGWPRGGWRVPELLRASAGRAAPLGSG